MPFTSIELFKLIKTDTKKLFNLFSDIFLIMQALLTKLFLLEKNKFYDTPQKIENAKFVPIFFISETTSCHRFVCFPRANQWSNTLKKCSNVAVVTTKPILKVIITQFGIFWVIMVAVAFFFEIFDKITKSNILPTNFKNLKKIKISKMEFSDILPKLSPSSYMLY